MANYKTLLVMRHAKSSWTFAGLPDHDRPLNKRGQRDAVQMAQFLTNQGIRIDRIAASTAVRAQRTADGLIKNIDGLSVSQLDSREEFYLAAPRIYLGYLQSIEDDSISTLMLVGHNPGLESLVHQLGKKWETMPTAAIACLELASDSWSEAKPSLFRLDHLWRPKEVLEFYQDR